MLWNSNAERTEVATRLGLIGQKDTPPEVYRTVRQPADFQPPTDDREAGLRAGRAWAKLSATAEELDGLDDEDQEAAYELQADLTEAAVAVDDGEGDGRPEQQPDARRCT